MNNGVTPNQENNANTENTQEPVITQSVPVTQLINDQPIGIIPQQQEEKVVVVKKKSRILPFLLLLVIALMAGVYFLYQKNIQDTARLKFECSPVGYKKETKLDLNSTLVQQLYNMVKTNIKEDVASVNFDDNMKLYLAYRQIPTDLVYDSNCDGFSQNSMEPFTCPLTTTFTPRAFKEETLKLAVKKLFGENVEIPNANIQLGKNCVGGFQYIEKRHEYVQGICQQQSATILSVEKELIEAVSTGNNIKLTEKVEYSGNQGAEIPEYLKNGQYIYTFKLDLNYNYIYVNKEYVEKFE